MFIAMNRFKIAPGKEQEFLQGKDVVIDCENSQAIKLVTFNDAIPKRKFDSAKGQIIISDRFDGPLPEFEMGDD